MLFYVTTGLGATLVKADDEDEAREKTLRKVGTYQGVKSVNVATKANIEWVRAIGGYVPE